jgi:hypothetical protein
MRAAALTRSMGCKAALKGLRRRNDGKEMPP